MQVSSKYYLDAAMYVISIAACLAAVNRNGYGVVISETRLSPGFVDEDIVALV